MKTYSAKAIAGYGHSSGHRPRVFALLFWTALVAGGLLVPGTAGAWDRKRHKLVQREAARLIAADTKQILLPFMRDAAALETGIDPDALKKTRRGRCSGKLHYVNPDGRAYKDRRPAKGGDAVRTLVFLEDYLRGALRDPKAKSTEVALALSLWIHIASDMSQPLHSGYRCDRGGNNRRVTGGRRARNLHGLWDGKLIDLYEKGVGGGPERGQAGADTAAVDLDYAAWSSEAARQVAVAYGCPAGAQNGRQCAICARHAPPIVVDEAYVAKHGPVLSAAARVGARRVAAGLDAIALGRAHSAAETQLRLWLRAQPGGDAVRRCFARLAKP